MLIRKEGVSAKEPSTPEAYRAWQCDPHFIEEFDRRIAAAYRESAAVIARFAPKAALRLIELTQSPKEEIARRACPDIISLHGAPLAPTKPAPASTEYPRNDLSEATASKILAALADAADAQKPT